MRPAEKNRQEPVVQNHEKNQKTVIEWDIDRHFSWNPHLKQSKCMTSTTLKPVGEGESRKFLVSF